MTTLDGRTFRWKQPEYTGENRCFPCTAVNVVITALAAIVAGAVWLPFGVAVVGIGLAAIYFRGYLVPGTPTLTKRYLPERIHRLFGTHAGPTVELNEDALDAGEIERALRSLDALEPCIEDTGGGSDAARESSSAAAADLCLTGRFRESWYERFETERADAETADRLFSGLDIDSETIDTERRSNAFVALAEVPTTTRTATLAKWEAEAAFLADAAADAVLRRWSPDWAALGVDARLELLGALRLWLDRCPSCSGAVSLGEERVESCCRSVDVVAATCGDCDARLFEAQFSPDAARRA
ncbi:hypothetical protein [Halobellus salinisoli]|uniref:hypothetical protein n=1 Tax=Halobellus salinisoli TaxID=3108500 RepID=UPI00300863D0